MYWARRAALAAIVLLMILTSVSIVAALRTPGDSPTAKLAEWAREHSLGPIVTLAETVQYHLNPPQEGGVPNTTALAAGVREAGATPLRIGAGARIAGIPLHAPLSSPVSKTLPGEGIFVPVSRRTAGMRLQVTYVRPDAVHTSYLTGVVWMSRNLRFVLHPGFEDPGLQGMSQPDKVKPSQYGGLVAAFNGGFRIPDANGGYYDNGKTVGTLTDGAASLVIDKQGHATVGTWGGDVTMTPNVAFVRQNLKPLISGGVVARDLNANVESTWGATVGGALAVWRSGIGVTSSGDLVYAMGDAMTVSDLADVLRRAGAVTAMQLDINRTWVSFMWFSHRGANPAPHKVGTFQEPANRYLADTSRDFLAVYAPTPTAAKATPST